MEASIQRIAVDWIAYSRYENVEEAPEQVAAGVELDDALLMSEALEI